MGQAGEFGVRVDAVLSEVLGQAGEDFALDREGLVTIAFPDEVDVTLRAVTEGRLLLVSAAICPLGAAEMALAALQRNHFELHPLGAFIAHDRDGNTLLLCGQIAEPIINAHDFGPWLAAFVAAASRLRAEFLLGPSGAARQSDGAGLVGEFLIRP